MPSPAVPQLGADVLVQALIDEQIEVCFANPGTSEMHMVAALDRNPKLRSVLALFEGVVTGAADGYARMAGKPAATLLHLGPGFANGMANIHNARKAGVPMLNLVGDHAVDHLRYDAPLTSDLEGMARTVSHWVGRANSAAEMGQRTREALAATRTRPAGIASLLIAADAAWGTAGDTTAAAMMHAPEAPQPDSALLSKALDALRRAVGKGMLLIGDNALCAEGVRLAAAICHTLNCRLAGQSSSRRTTRGGGLPHVPRVPYPIDLAIEFMAGTQALVCVGAPPPVAFFAYPGKPSSLVPVGCETFQTVEPGMDPLSVLRALADIVGVRADEAPVFTCEPIPEPTGALTHETVGRALASTLPEGAIVVDESITTGRLFSYDGTAGCARHDWINNMGGSIGYGLPGALGASVACPDRRVIALVGDGSAFYTEQALWSMAREQSNVTVVIYANRSYAILKGEWDRMKAGQAGPAARDMLTLDRPEPDWCRIAEGHGVPAIRVTDAQGYAQALKRANGQQGPTLIEVML